MVIFDLTENCLLDLSFQELEETNGGFIPLIIIGAAILLASCGSEQNNKNDPGSSAINIQCDNCTITIHSPDSVLITK